MPAQRSPNRLYAEVNLTYIIHVYEYLDTLEITDENGRKTKVNRYKNQQIVSAATLSKFIPDEQMKISLFNEVLDSGRSKYTRLIRNRLKINFSSK